MSTYVLRLFPTLFLLYCSQNSWQLILKFILSTGLWHFDNMYLFYLGWSVILRIEKTLIQRDELINMLFPQRLPRDYFSVYLNMYLTLLRPVILVRKCSGKWWFCYFLSSLFPQELSLIYFVWIVTYIISTTKDIYFVEKNNIFKNIRLCGWNNLFSLNYLKKIRFIYLIVLTWLVMIHFIYLFVLTRLVIYILYPVSDSIIDVSLVWMQSFGYQ